MKFYILSGQLRDFLIIELKHSPKLRPPPIRQPLNNRDQPLDLPTPPTLDLPNLAPNPAPNLPHHPLHGPHPLQNLPHLNPTVPANRLIHQF
jgi:hypothetical protein